MRQQTMRPDRFAAHVRHPRAVLLDDRPPGRHRVRQRRVRPHRRLSAGGSHRRIAQHHPPPGHAARGVQALLGLPPRRQAGGGLREEPGAGRPLLLGAGPGDPHRRPLPLGPLQAHVAVAGARWRSCTPRCGSIEAAAAGPTRPAPPAWRPPRTTCWRRCATLGFAGLRRFHAHHPARRTQEPRRRSWPARAPRWCPPLPRPGTPEDGRHDAIRAIYDGCPQAYQHLYQLFCRLDGYVALNEQLGLKSASVLELTHGLPVHLAQHRGEVRPPRPAGRRARRDRRLPRRVPRRASRSIVNGLTARIGTTSERLAAVIFDLAGARLQTEMILVFCHELITRPASDRRAGARRAEPASTQMIADLKERVRRHHRHHRRRAADPSARNSAASAPRPTSCRRSC